jgi:hypothetical protein
VPLPVNNPAAHVLAGLLDLPPRPATLPGSPVAKPVTESTEIATKCGGNLSQLEAR